MKNRVGFPKKTINDVPLDDQVVLVRTDYNVPLSDDGSIDDDYRIRMSLPTLSSLVERGCRVVIISHLGRPDGKVDPQYSLEPVATRLGELLGRRVGFVSDCLGDKVRQAVKRLGRGELLILENLRFHAGEESNDREFAHGIVSATRARYMIQDGFGVVHRAHASTSAITEWLPSIAGLLLEREFTIITGAMNRPKRPMVAILGGAKISDKIGVIEAFVRRADKVIIGGAMANTFLEHAGAAIGKSLTESGLGDTIDRIYQAAGDDKEKIVLPIDVAVGYSTGSNEERRDKAIGDIQPDDIILDIGAASIEKTVKLIAGASTVVWNGTLGLAEHSQFAHGSARVALELATHPEILSIIGGGDTADFVLGWDARGGESFSHVSTGGGASLELMAGRPMPGIEALLDA